MPGADGNNYRYGMFCAELPQSTMRKSGTMSKTTPLHQDSKYLRTTNSRRCRTSSARSCAIRATRRSTSTRHSGVGMRRTVGCSSTTSSTTWKCGEYSTRPTTAGGILSIGIFGRNRHVSKRTLCIRFLRCLTRTVRKRRRGSFDIKSSYSRMLKTISSSKIPKPLTNANNRKRFMCGPFRGTVPQVQMWNRSSVK